MKYRDFIQEIEKDAEYNEAKETLKIHFALGDAVLRGRMKRGWSQTELAERVGTKQANISHIEAGQGNPTINLLQKLLKVLELEINFAPAPSSTASKSVSFSQEAIPVANWPGSKQQSASNTQTQVYPVGGWS
jgi:ribosome-binding protein aMBF1 (putative translation factor)